MWRALMRGVLVASASVAWALPALAQDRTTQSANTVQLAGRQLRCDGIRLRLDSHLNNLGAAAVDERVLLLNPGLLRKQTKIVQLFVFHHECGHHRVGASELKADCWAVNRGLRDGWLNRGSLAQVCRSFGGAPETATHPSAERRCANLDRCLATAEATVADEQIILEEHVKAVEHRNAPKLVVKPRLVRTSMVR